MCVGAMSLMLMMLSASCGGNSAQDFVSPTPPPTPPPLDAFFQASGTSATPNLVRLVGTDLGAGRVRLDVVIDGPTINTDLYGFAFDLVLGDSSVARGPSSAVIGDALSTVGCQGSRAFANSSGDRIVVGVSKLGSCPGNGVSAGEFVIVSVTVLVLKTGLCSITLEGSPTSPQYPGNDPSAIDSTGSRIDTIVFDPAAASVGA